MAAGFLFLHQTGWRLMLPTFLFLTFGKTKNIFTMRDLSLFTLVFALMLVCKVGAVGNYATMGWSWVLLPLGLHYVLKFFNYVYGLSKHRLSLTETLKKMQASSVHRKNEKIYKNAVNDFKKELRNGNAAN